MNRTDRRGYRGLLRRIRAGEHTLKGRKLLVTNPASKRNGVCCWCGQPVEPGPTGRQRGWHEECRVWMFLAIGSHEAAWRTTASGPLINGRPTCVLCGATSHLEVDHVVPLSVAHELRRQRLWKRWWAAWTPWNLRYLCHACHLEKTRSDNRFLKHLRRRRTLRSQAPDRDLLRTPPTLF